MKACRTDMSSVYWGGLDTYLPHVELLPVDQTDVSPDHCRVVKFPATNNKTEKGVVRSVS